MNKEKSNDFFNRVYAEYYDYIYIQIKKILYSQVDDDITSCAQETFKTAWIKIDSLINHKNIAGWLVKTAQNISYRFNEKYLTRQKLADDSLRISPNAVSSRNKRLTEIFKKDFYKIKK